MEIKTILLILFFSASVIFISYFLYNYYCQFFINITKRDPLEKYIKAKKQYKFKQDIILKLATDDFYVNSLNHYFFVIDGERHVFGIVELLMYFGDDLFFQVKIKKYQIKNDFEKQQKRKHLTLIVNNK